MSVERITPQNPRIQDAVSELQRLITTRYPEATFTVAAGEDPEGIYLTATVDTDDLTTVLETVEERLVELQVDQEIPLYLVPVRPVERVLAELPRRPERPLARVPRLEEPVFTPPRPGAT
jgi:hypothetical protein